MFTVADGHVRVFRPKWMGNCGRMRKRRGNRCCALCLFAWTIFVVRPWRNLFIGKRLKMWAWMVLFLLCLQKRAASLIRSILAILLRHIGTSKRGVGVCSSALPMIFSSEGRFESQSSFVKRKIRLPCVAAFKGKCWGEEMHFNIFCLGFIYARDTFFLIKWVNLLKNCRKIIKN